MQISFLFAVAPILRPLKAHRSRHDRSFRRHDIDILITETEIAARRRSWRG